MKKQFTSLLTTLFVGFVGLSVTTSNVHVTHALSNEVPMSQIPASEFANGDLKSVSYTNEGVKILIEGADTVGSSDAWRKNAIVPSTNTSNPNVFSLAYNEKITMEFSAKCFDANGSQLSKSQNGFGFDVYIMNASTNSQLGIMRIWTDSYGATNGSHSVDIMTTDWTAHSSEYAILGDATEESSFFIQFDRENFISSYVAGKDEITPLGSAAQIAERKEALKDVDQIYFKIQGDNGYTNETQVIIKSINGQSLANDGTNFIDDIAPAFNNALVNNTVAVNEEYTIPLEASDLFGDVTYKMIINGEETEGKTFTPTETGTLNVTFIATDSVGNTSEKILVFEVVDGIQRPVITSLPTIEDMLIDPLSNIVFEKPTFEDETGSAETVLKIYNSDDTLLTTIEENSDHQFKYFVNGTFQSGTYKLVYEVTNSAGTTESDPIEVTINVKTKDIAGFITGDTTNMFAEYVDQGIALSTSDNFKQQTIGVYDLRDEIDVKFIVNKTTVNGLANDTTYVNFTLTSVENENIKFVYRVWIGFSGEDRPTNVFVYSTDGSYKDYTEMGWIARNVDGISDCYHMSFNAEDTFVGEKTGGMTPILQNAAEHIRTLYNGLTSKKFKVSFETSNLSGGSLFEMIIKDVNTQNFANGFTWSDVQLSVKSDIPESIAVNGTLNLDVYAKDIQGNEQVQLIVTHPDGTNEPIDVTDGKVEFTFNEIGTYNLVIIAKGSNGVEVKKSYSVICKSSIGSLTIDVEGEYETIYDMNTSVSILGATYSADVAESKITVVKPNGESDVVAAGDQYEFKTPGIYKIIYTAQDNAEPTPNVETKEYLINVPDTSKPVVEVTLNSSYKVNDEVNVDISVTDDSEYDVTVTLTKPDGTSEKSTNKEAYSYKVTQIGKYTVKITVEDIYGNKETVTKEFTVVAEEPTESSNLGLIIGICAGVVVVGGAVALTIILKKKKATKVVNTEEKVEKEENEEGQETRKD